MVIQMFRLVTTGDFIENSFDFVAFLIVLKWKIAAFAKNLRFQPFAHQHGSSEKTPRIATK